MKIWILCISLLSLLYARENPFKGMFGESNSTVSTPIPFLVHKPYPKELEIIPFKEPKHKVVTVKKVVKAPTPTVKKEPVKAISAPAKIKKIAKVQKKSKPKKAAYRTIYKNYFLKVQSNTKGFKIFTKDRLLRQSTYTSPIRVALDFEKLQYFHTKTIRLNKSIIKKLTLGSHHDFYRLTITLNKHKKYRLKKKPYGYLLTF